MMSFIDIIKHALEVPSFDCNQLLYMAIRAIIIYFIGVSIARSNKKIIGIRTPFNFILFVMLGSIFANAIIDEKSFLPIVGTVLVLILLNYIMKKIAFHFLFIERFVKGASVELIKDGKINWDEMRAHAITERELLNELASQAHIYDINKIEQAILASDGSINFVFKTK